VTAVVLGGFFAFVCLLVLYKTKCKPMWKNRRKRLTNTPATQSMVDGNEASYGPPSAPCGRGIDILEPRVDVEDVDADESCYYDDEDGEDYEGFEGHDEYEFECIPLRSVFTGGEGEGEGEEGQDEDDGDIYFLDEFGNYVFPVADGSAGSLMSATPCSCQPSSEDVCALWRRRQSQVRPFSLSPRNEVPTQFGLLYTCTLLSLFLGELHFQRVHGQELARRLSVHPSDGRGGRHVGSGGRGARPTVGALVPHLRAAIAIRSGNPFRDALRPAHHPHRSVQRRRR